MSVFPAEVTAAETHRLSQKFQNRTNASKNLVFFHPKIIFWLFLSPVGEKIFRSTRQAVKVSWSHQSSFNWKLRNFGIRKKNRKYHRSFKMGHFWILKLKNRFTLLYANIRLLLRWSWVWIRHIQLCVESTNGSNGVNLGSSEVTNSATRNM